MSNSTNNLQRLQQRPTAQAEKVEDILGWIQMGRIRIPDFQRPLRWRAKEVLDLFDSIYRGLPIGVLLLSREYRSAATLHLGPLQIEAPERHDALLVVDGQQRLTALAAVLLHPMREPRADIFSIWFDTETDSFKHLQSGVVNPRWVPLNILGDSFKTLHWLDAWPHRMEEEALVRKILELGKRLREYVVPVYVVEGADESLLREIFYRINNTGVAMRDSEVFDALYGRKEDSLRSAVIRVNNSGFGANITEDFFLRCLVAVEDVDPNTSPVDIKPTVGAIERTEAALSRAISFIKDDVGIPHGRLLPYKLSLIVFSRFFSLYPEPLPRARMHLRWWLWRGALTEAHSQSSQGLLRQYQKMIRDSEIDSSLRVLSHVPSSLQRIELGGIWNSRAARSKLFCTMLLSLQPVELDGEPVVWTAERVCERLNEGLGIALSGIVQPLAEGISEPLLSRSFSCDTPTADRLRTCEPQHLASHGLDERSVELLLSGQRERFLARRAEILQPLAERFFSERAGLTEHARPSIWEIVRPYAPGVSNG